MLKIEEFNTLQQAIRMATSNHVVFDMTENTLNEFYLQLLAISLKAVQMTQANEDETRLIVDIIIASPDVIRAIPQYQKDFENDR